MMTRKINSFFILLLCFAFYDKIVKGLEEYSVNLDVFFFVSIYLFIVFWILETRKNANKFDKKILTALSLPFILRISLNLLSINQDYNTFRNLVSNQYVDYATWMTLAVIIIILSWQKCTALR